jgi:hypothetical protein
MRFEELTEREKAHYERMWTVDKARWVLHAVHGRLGPLNLESHTVRLLEDPEIHDYVVGKMQEAGVPIVGRVPWLNSG